ncbi:hypothetical protein PIN31115_02099 [Pandoraea iniqua]|uniref:Uncharacterized protein n=1 Tax=Pandoraea iniqua TaxID=2508288 RepID=A0A5E4UPJ9_9BURK|nr:hypothetical protein [Pandoraea iniqua]VVE00939.1 hypothetical protein PIN31115_02099 [Pandoraea iniqua]
MKRSRRDQDSPRFFEKVLETIAKVVLVRFPALCAIIYLGKTALGSSAIDGIVVVCAISVFFWLLMEWVWKETRDQRSDEKGPPSDWW